MLDRDLLIRAVNGLFDGRPGRINIDVEAASQLTGHTHGQIEESLDDIKELFIARGKTLGVSSVAIDVYKHRNIVMSQEKQI